MPKPKEIKTITSAIFRNIVLFTVSEPGAMGAPDILEFLTASGEYFYIDITNPRTSYDKLKECFPILDNCCFDGLSHTTIDENYEEIYLGFGNHLIINKKYLNLAEKHIGCFVSANEAYMWEEKLPDIIAELKAKEDINE